MNDPFAVLGLDRSATAADVRRARRDLARAAHPDAGGDATRMQHLNAAAADALRELSDPSADSPPPSGSDATHSTDRITHGTDGADDIDVRRRDHPSFTVEALPVETFEALLLAAAVVGEVADDEPPYELTVLLGEPLRCWCRLSVVPDAGASTVSVAIAPVEEGPIPSIPSIQVVRDTWIAALNELDWSDL